MFSWSPRRVLLFQESQHPIGSDNLVEEENASLSATSQRLECSVCFSRLQASEAW